ncbi:MAG: HTH-type transcriptional regulator AcrR [Candidatus Ordinivivax streblomastigis]|uniref:HTH-type transcriptional regulator AcrR n=1 Tax=Candidatus Ordinivivax streblomastigis TaxID=2540710 RepID=A0A5M8NZU2_9BACT|nr:MAG: HTH-type transcriptional regulator AcrR [Candidatus Ordinivivax streblomastigis]
MPRTKEQYEKIRAEKRELIKQTALKLFATKGYAATSINEIALSAGISKGLMYNYFDGKESLMQHIWDDLVEEFTLLDANNDGEVTSIEAENFIDKTFELLINRREEMKLYYQFSFQPDILDFLTHKYNAETAQKRQGFIIKYFADKLPIADKNNAFFTVLVFLKGLCMVVTYTENIYNVKFLNQYKEHLKTILI